MLNSFIRYVAILIFLAYASTSCVQKEAYYKFAPIPENMWNKDYEVYFPIDSSLIILKESYTISLEIVHNITYPYKKIFLSINMYNAQDSILLQDTLECALIDELGGWKGSGNGATRQLSALYKTNFKIDPALHNKISVRHAMQDFKLRGIEKIGLKIN